MLEDEKGNIDIPSVRRTVTANNRFCRLIDEAVAIAAPIDPKRGIKTILAIILTTAQIAYIFRTFLSFPLIVNK